MIWLGKNLFRVGLGIGIVFLAAVLLFQAGSKTTFDINAQTEFLSGVIMRGTSIEVGEGALCSGPRNPLALSGRSGDCEGYAQGMLLNGSTIGFTEDSRIRVSRLGTGDLKIDLRRDDDAPAVVVDGQRPVPSPVALVVPASQLVESAPRLAIPLVVREMSIGSVTGTNATGRDPMLLNAEIVIMGQQVLSGTIPHMFGFKDRAVFRTEKIELGLGDMIRVPEDVADSDVVFSGLAVAGPDHGLALVMRVKAQRLEVSRFNTVGYHLSVSLVDRLGSDPLATTIWALIGLLSGSGLLILFPRLFGRSESSS